MAGVHRGRVHDERATGMKFNDYKPRSSTIVQQESNFNSRIGCDETCRGSSTEYPLNEINPVIEFQPGEMISIPWPGAETTSGVDPVFRENSLFDVQDSRFPRGNEDSTRDVS